MSNEIEDRIKQIKDNADKAKTVRIRAEAKLESLTKQKQELITELKKMNVDYETLDEIIADLKNEIEDMLDKIDKMIPYDLIKDKED